MYEILTVEEAVRVLEEYNNNERQQLDRLTSVFRFFIQRKKGFKVVQFGNANNSVVDAWCNVPASAPEAYLLDTFVGKHVRFATGWNFGDSED